MYIIVAGCHKVGSNLAKILSQENHDVVVVDQNPDSFKALGSGFNGITITGMPIDEDILRQAGIEHADALAAVTSDDNMNVMVSQVAKNIFNVPKVITRIYDPERDHVFRQMGMDTLCPTMMAVEQIRDRLTHAGHHERHDFNGTEIFFHYVKPGRRMIGKSLTAMMTDNVFAILKKGVFLFAQPNMKVEAEDTLVLAEYVR